MEYMLTLDNVSRTFNDERHVVAVKDVSVNVHAGEFFVFVGLSGSGKSTLLRMMSGLDAPTSGSVHLADTITQHDIGFVFQQFALLPWLSVYDNVQMPLIARHIPAAQRHKRVVAELEMLGLGKLMDAMPRALSGGQRQRVGIARALVTEPKVLFLDEPFSELDSFTAEKLRGELLQVWGERKFTVVMVTHILPEAVQMADRIAVLQANPGRIAHIFDNTIARPRSMRSPEVFALEDQIRERIMKG